MPLTDVDQAAENIVAQQLSQVSGVSQVLVGGQQTPAIRVQVDPAKLAGLGLTLEDVRTVLANSTANAPKGTIDGKHQSYTVYSNDQRMTAQEYNDTIINYRDGGAVRVRDIGNAVSGPQNRELTAWQDNKPAVLLLVFKQPGANVIETVNAVQAKLPALLKNIPPDIKVDVVSDRTQTIRASVSDVQFTLAMSICLVVSVIFVFLRNAWATIIPSVTIPVALLGTLGVMFVCGFSLDNLSLMGLTIAVGFVVDDAIVMLENIVRHVEEGETPMQAAIKGAGEIGFTILSISISLVAVFIPLLLMGGIIGRLFREFAVTVSITIAVSCLASLTLTPMMASRFLTAEKKEHGRFYKFVENIFDAILGFYERTLDVALRFRFVTLMVFFATLVLTGVLYTLIPKGFFPSQDTGIIIGITDAAQDVSFEQMTILQKRVNQIVGEDPAVAGVTSSIGAGSGGQTANNGRIYISLKPWSERDVDARGIIARINKRMQDVQGIRFFMQPAQDVRVGGRLSRTEYQYTLSDPNAAELNQWAPKILDKLKTLPQLADVTSDAAGAGLTATLTYDKDAAARYGIQPGTIDATLNDAFGQRQVAQYFTDLKAYYVILEVTPNQQGDLNTLQQLYVRSGSGQPVPLSTFVRIDTAPVQPLVVNHQSQFPAVTISYNLKAGSSLGDSVTAIQAAQAELGRARHRARPVPRHRASLPGLAQQPAGAHRRRAGGRLHHPRHPVRELHPAADDPVHAALGRRRRAAHAVGVRLRPDGDRHRRHHPADRHREEERHHAGRRRDPPRAQRGGGAVGRHPPRLPAAVPADPDDHDGCAAVRPAADAGRRRRVGAAQAARLRDGRRLGAQPGSDALHDTGDLPLPRQAADLAGARQEEADAAAGGRAQQRGAGDGAEPGLNRGVRPAPTPLPRSARAPTRSPAERRRPARPDRRRRARRP